MDLGQRYRTIRQASEQLAEPLSTEDCAIQSMPDASPTKWHLAHTSWFFETLILERAVQGYKRFHPGFRSLFNSYYNSLGDPYSRPDRGLLSRPSLEEVYAYRRHVDRGVLALLDDDSRDRAAADTMAELGLHHEQQHQELILTDIKHALSLNPLHPSYRTRAAEPDGAAAALVWHGHAEGVEEIGYAGPDFSFDNERPRHRVFIEAFEIASRPVTNAEYLEFMSDGGYARPDLWLSDGWAVVEERGWQAPLYWMERDGNRWAQTLGGLHPLRADEPVCHVSYYEADAYARWAGARLPSEAEWECVAGSNPSDGNFAESGRLHPAPTPTDGGGPAGLYGDVWEWTRSPYAPYPGFTPLPGDVGEYNAKFMSNQIVLRGGSCATPRPHIRRSYRNFFYPDARWQFSGLRLARDAA